MFLSINVHYGVRTEYPIGDIFDNNWHHIVLVTDAEERLSYLDDYYSTLAPLNRAAVRLYR